MLIMIVSICFLFSIELCFEIDPFEIPSFSTIIKALAFFLYFIDILLKFHTSYYECGLCVTDSQKIFQNYLKKTFICDFVSLLSIFLSFFNDHKISFFKILFIFPIITLEIFTRRFEIKGKQGISLN